VGLNPLALGKEIKRATLVGDDLGDDLGDQLIGDLERSRGQRVPEQLILNLLKRREDAADFQDGLGDLGDRYEEGG
jgi:hypothetical protein